MQLLAIKDLFTGKIIQAMCWTLVHSLWLGLLLAAAAAVIVLCTKKSRAALRYNLLAGALLVFSAGIAITFYLQLNNSIEKQQVPVAQTGITLTEKNIPVLSATETTNMLDFGAVVSFLNEYAAIIVCVWFLIIAFRLAGLISGLHGLHKIKSRQLSDPGEYWNSRIKSLATQLHINKRVRFFQSGIAKIPMVIGHFKPIILFPVALLATLPQDEIEGILVHELAHIRRKDYLVNMFQHIMEIFLFFNPAVLWVSTLIKTERENCCDDIAVAYTGDKRNYINALLSFQEYNMATPQFATGLAGKKYYLLQRVKRIIYNNNKTLNAMEKTILASGLVLASVLALAFSQKETTHAQFTAGISLEKTGRTPIALITLDTVPVSGKVKLSGNTNTIVDGKKYDLKFKNDVITELTIDGEAIPDGKIADYKTITDKIIKLMVENIEKEISLSEKGKIQAEASKVQAERTLELTKKLQSLSLQPSLQTQKELTDVNSLILKLNEVAVAKDQRLALIDKKEIELAALLPKLKNELAIANELNVVKSQQAIILAQKEKELITNLSLQKPQAALVQAELAEVKSQLLALNANKSLQLSKQEELKAEKLQLLLAKVGSERTMLQLKELEGGPGTTSAEIIDELLKEKIIKSKKNLSFTLNSNELIVNGITQPDTVHRKFKEKYVKSLTWNFNFNNKE